MPITLTPIAVTDDDGAVQQYHIAEVAGEQDNLDAARAAGHVVEVTWADVFLAVAMRCDTDGHWTPGIVEEFVGDLRTFLCDRCFGLGGE